MKKILLTMVAALTAVTFTNCSKEEAFAPEQVGKPFELVASPETRTVNDGMATLWAEGDAVNVFHAVEGDTETFFNDGEFTLADVTTGTFTGTLTGDELTEDSSYDWYMFYPYSSYISTPANTSTGYMPVGSQSNASQAQTGINSMAHIAGSNYPMAGKVEGVMGGEKPHITMKHVSALVRVNVTNKNAEAINVTSVKLTAPEDIVGTYYINFAGETLEFTGSGDSYVSSTATLTVTDGVIEAGETASFYLAIKPIELENEAITVAINAEGLATVEQEFTALTTSFSAGKIKTINVAYESSDEIEWTTIADIHAATAEGTFNIKDATVVAVGKYNSLLNDGTGYLYSYQNLGVAVGDIVNITNAVTSTYGERQIKEGATVEVVGTTTVEHPTPEVIADATAYNALVSDYTVGQYVTIYASSLSIGSYLNFTVDGGSATGSFITPSNTAELAALNGLPAKITGYVCYLNTSNYFYVFMTAIEALPYLTIDPASLSWNATETTAKTATVSSNDENWTIDETTVPDWAEVVKTDATTLTVTPQANEGAARTAEVVLKHATEDISTTVTLSQGEAGVSTVEVAFDTTSTTFVYSGSGTSGIMTATDGTISVVLDKGTSTSNVNSSYYNPIRMYKGHLLTFSGATITKIVVNCSSSSYAEALTLKTGAGSISKSGYVVTYTSTGDTEVVLNNTAQVRISRITVTYTK